jgi:hypothetical protein
MAPQVLGTPRSPAHKGVLMDTKRIPVSGDAFYAAARVDQDDTVEAHYASLERPCVCLEGWVFVGYVDEYGEERVASYRCRRCADSR